MRALYFCEHFWPLIGGLEVVSADLVTRLADRGHEITVLTNQPDGLPAHDELNGVQIRRIPFLNPLGERDLDGLAAARTAMADLVDDYRPDLVHAAFTGFGSWLLPAGGPPLIMAMHGPWPTVDFASGMAGRLLRRTTWVTACSEATRTALLETAPYLADRTSVILSAVDPGFDGEPPDLPDEPVLLCCGRLSPEKGFHLAIEALALLDARARLIVVGDGQEREGLEALAVARGVADRVEFCGWVSPDAVHEQFARASVVVVPSLLEGFGLVAIEAGHMRRPVVAADVGGLPEAVVDGVTGILVASQDPAAIAAAVERLAREPDTARAMGAAGRARALEDFGGERHADAWEALYRRIATRNKETVP